MDEFQNFATESFESILSEARKFRLNLIVANQFMTQLTDKIREGILGNVGTIICGRIGVTDAQIMEKAFMPTFNAEDLHNQPNHHAIAQVMMFDMPSKPFTMTLRPPEFQGNPEVLSGLKMYSATKYGRTRAEVEKEIDARLGAEVTQAASKGEKGFLESWISKKQGTPEEIIADIQKPSLQGQPGVDTAIKNDGPVFDNVVPDEDVEQKGGAKAEQMAMPDGNADEGEVFKIRRY